jgi:hypothetical protein
MLLTGNHDNRWHNLKLAGFVAAGGGLEHSLRHIRRARMHCAQQLVWVKVKLNLKCFKFGTVEIAKQAEQLLVAKCFSISAASRGPVWGG